MGGDVFEQERFATTLGHFAGVIRHNPDRFTRGRHGIEMSEIRFGCASEGDMFADPFGPGSDGHFRELFEPLSIQPTRRPKAQPKTMNEQRMSRFNLLTE